MTTQTIRNGTSIDVPIPTGQTLKVVAVTGTYTITVIRGTGIGTALATAATGGSYGAYAYDRVVRIVASSASEIDFDVAVTPDVATDTVANYSFDSTGQVTGLVGPGGVSVLSLGKVTGLSAILLGDSRTAQCFSPAGGVGYVPKWAVLGNASLGWPFTLVNGGVSSNTTTQMLSRLPALLTANPGDGWLIIRGSVNDICNGDLVASSPTGTQVTKEMIVANFASMIGKGVAAGKKIALCTEIGNNASSATPTTLATAQGQLIRQAFDYVNRYIRAICAANGYVLIDLESASMDPATGLPATGHQISDGIHISYVGSCQEGQAFKAAFSGLVTVPTRVPSFRLSPRNLLGPVASAAGTVTVDAANDTRIIAPATSTGLPSGWTVAQFRAGGAGAASKVARTDFAPGTSAQLAFSSTASFGGTGFYIGGDSTNALSRWDQLWVASTAYAVGRRVSANGMSYVCTTAGTTSGSNPTSGWATAEGSLVTDGATFLCQRKPITGETIQASIDMGFGSLSGNAMPRIYLNFVDTAGATFQTALCDADLSGAAGVAGNWLPATARFVSMPLAIPSDNIRYIFVSAGMYGENGSAANMIVHRAEVLNLSQAAL